MMKKALIVQGGWDGHNPKGMSALLAEQLRKHDFEVTLSDTLDAFKDLDLTQFDLLVPIWTMGTIQKEQLTPLLEAVKGGIGIAGVHGGMGDAFRNETEFQFMVGGQWVAHPGNAGVTYEVRMDGVPSPITEGLPNFTVTTEQYYMHVDPGITVLATTQFKNGVVMPVTWTKHYGQGRVFYCSLGHTVDIVEHPVALEMVTRGMLWASERETEAVPVL
jgi:type 1 glutamine amidotransferase